MHTKLNQMINPKVLVFALVVFGIIALSGRASGMLTGHPIEFDLATDNYTGTANFQLVTTNPDVAVLNTELVKISGAGSTSRADRKDKVKTVYDPVKIARVYKGVDDLYLWRQDIENGQLSRYDVTITLLDSAFNPKRIIILENAWPSAWQFPAMDPGNAGPAIELIQFEAERVYEQDL